MNGRAYDYNLGRFLSVDPFVQSPGNSQSMNPYSYIMNNPLAGTDPSGYMIEDDSCGLDKFSCGNNNIKTYHWTDYFKRFKLNASEDSGAENSNSSQTDINQETESLMGQESLYRHPNGDLLAPDSYARENFKIGVDEEGDDIYSIFTDDDGWRIDIQDGGYGRKEILRKPSSRSISDTVWITWEDQLDVIIPSAPKTTEYFRKLDFNLDMFSLLRGEVALFYEVSYDVSSFEIRQISTERVFLENLHSGMRYDVDFHYKDNTRVLNVETITGFQRTGWHTTSHAKREYRDDQRISTEHYHELRRATK